MYTDIGEGCNNLGLGRKVAAFLEFKVPDSSRKGKVAVDAAKIYEASGCTNSRLLGYLNISLGRRTQNFVYFTLILWLVVEG